MAKEQKVFQGLGAAFNILSMDNKGKGACIVD